MVEMVSGILTAAKIVGYIANYGSYKFEQRKEDDKAIRSWLLIKLNDCRGKLLDIMEATEDNNICDNSRKIIDQIDMFKAEVSSAESIQKLPFFTIGKSANVDRLIEHDATIIGEVEKVRNLLTGVQLEILDDINASRKGINTVRSGVSNARNGFSERISFIKGAK